MNLKNFQFEDVDLKDYPDFCDAYVSYAEHEDGTPLTEEELEAIPDDVVYDKLMDYIF